MTLAGCGKWRGDAEENTLFTLRMTSRHTTAMRSHLRCMVGLFFREVLSIATFSEGETASKGGGVRGATAVLDSW
jgi:hypothetical protein